MEKIFVYFRVSTNKQVEKNTQKNQMRSVEEFLKDMPVQIIEKFSDLGISGAEKNREQFNCMLSRLKEVNAIAVYDLDRLVRDMEIVLDLMQILMQKNIKIYECRTKTIKDLTKDNDQLLFFIGVWISSIERKKILDRQKIGIERCKKEKGKWGRNKKILNIKKYKELREKGIPKRTIAKILGLDIRTLYNRLKEEGFMQKNNEKKIQYRCSKCGTTIKYEDYVEKRCPNCPKLEMFRKKRREMKIMFENRIKQIKKEEIFAELEEGFENGY
jgi:DNA invertase Pin-like site-specific DNA recombinase